ncbi:MAG: hypothetical protein GQ529_10440, partial [Methyloprofundus sp.]|nr:hypothetical protein [Methyloprofundus sp.]
MKNTYSHLSKKIVVPILLASISLQTSIIFAGTISTEMFAQLGFSEQEKQDVLNGKLIQRMPKERSEQELAVTLAFRLKKDAEQLRNNFIKGLSIDKNEDIVSHQFISPDADFPVFQLTAEEQKEISKLLEAEPGDTFNLSVDEIKSFNALAKTDAAALKQLQKLLKSRYQAYRQGGPAAISPYQRSAKKQYKLGEYFSNNRLAVLPALSKSFPEFYKALNTYPQYKPAGLQERFILLKLTIEGRPAFALEHRMAMQENGAELMASAYFYVTHTLNGQQGLGMLLPNGEDSV